MTDGSKQPVDGENGNNIDNGNVQPEQLSDEVYELPSDLPVQAYAKALYPFKGE